jgi:tellurite resistance protein TerC
MEIFWSWIRSPEFWILVGFHVFILVMLTLDLVVFHRHAHEISLTEAAVWSVVWIALALSFAAGIWQCWHLWRPEEPDQGSAKALEFLAGYLVEKGLSVDNLFVFLVIFRYFGVPAHLQHRVLLWGILSALVLRAFMILVGAALVAAFHWLLYVFGVYLIYIGYRLTRSDHEEIDPSKNWWLRMAKRVLPLVDSYDSARFWVRREGRWYATPLPLVLLVVESTDVTFALDSIPAVFGITKDTFIIYTSNIFAILGLRAMYFLIANFLGKFRYLNIGLAMVLIFVGLKMLVEDPLHPYLEAQGIGPTQLILLSLAVISFILAAAVLASIVVGPEPPAPKPAEQAVP